MKLRVPKILVVALLSVAALPSFAGVHFQSKSTTTAEKQKPTTMVVEGWADGPKAKVTFREVGQNPMMKSGMYMLTHNGSQTMLLVNPEEKTYMEFDPLGMLQGVGQMMNSMGGLMSMEFSDPKVEKLLDEDGGSILGHSTRHVRLKTTYNMSMKVIGMKRQSQIETIQDVWVASGWTDLGLGAWFRKAPPKTGHAALDKLVAAEWGRIDGIPLKSITVATTNDGKRTSVTRTEMEVTAFENASVPESTFVLPAGYERQEMPMMPGGAPPR
jgi:hypothetical protein